MKRQIHIAFAGLDGAGKSTQIEVVKKRLEERGFKVKVQCQFNTELGAMCMDIIKHTADSYIRAITFALDKYIQNLNNTPDISYDLILYDRSYYCAIAYAGAQGIPEDWIRSLYKYTQTYTLCLYLDISPSTSYLRKGLDDKSPAIDKRQFLDVRRIYLELVAIGELKRIDAEKEFDEVTNDIEGAILEVVGKCQ